MRRSAGGGRHTCAVTPAVVKCWGLNDAGQLGNGAIITTPPYGRPTPVAVSGLSGCVPRHRRREATAVP